MKQRKFWMFEAMFILVGIILIIIFNGYFQEYEMNYMRNSVNSYEAHLESIIGMYRNVAEFAYKDITKNEKIMNEIKKLNELDNEDDIDEIVLVHSLQNKFINLMDLGFRQTKIINYDREVIAKMFTSNELIEREEGAVENISEVEEFALITQEYYEGIEIGINYSSIRFIFPIYDENEFLAILEFNLPDESIIERLSDLYDGYYSLYIHAEELEGKSIKNYVASECYNGFYNDLTVLKQNKESGIDEEIVNIINCSFDAPAQFDIHKPSIINKVIDNKSYQMVMMPYKNLDGNIAAYLISYMRDDYNLLLLKNRNQNIWIIVLIFGIFIAANYILYLYQIKYKALSRTDNLTKLNNRSILDKELMNELHQCLISGKGVFGMMIDIDHFKRVNDNYGHMIGDQVLIELSDIILKNIRSSDYLIRWGGEEFLIILKDTEKNDGLAVAEKLRQAVFTHMFEQVGQISISLGISEMNKDEKFDDFIDRVDQFLYLAKENGRNRVETD